MHFPDLTYIPARLRLSQKNQPGDAYSASNWHTTAYPSLIFSHAFQIELHEKGLMKHGHDALCRLRRGGITSMGVRLSPVGSGYKMQAEAHGNE